MFFSLKMVCSPIFLKGGYSWSILEPFLFLPTCPETQLGFGFSGVVRNEIMKETFNSTKKV